MGLKVVKAGMFTTIQDGGRVGIQQYGVPVCGFMDTESAHLANLLVGNVATEALIECTLLGPTFEVLQDTVIAITGADMLATIDGTVVEMNKPIRVKTNQKISLGSAKEGLRTYMAIAGGINTTLVFNSKSTYTYGNFGGLKGRALKKGDVIDVLYKEHIGGDFGKVKRSPILKNIQLNCFKGPEFELFSELEIQKLITSTYKVSQNSNRMGIRLEGKTLELGEQKEIISSAIVKGTVQITSSGQPIVMMADAPTTGGYLRIANLDLNSINKLAQASFSTRIRFSFL